MLHNKRTNRLFLHNPKTAGMSLTEWLVSVQGYESVYDAKQVGVFNDEDNTINRHSITPPGDIRGAEVWCVVRHPLNRWSSFYNYCVMCNLEGAGSGMTFNEFTRERLNWLKPQMDYVNASHYWLRLEHLSEGLSYLGYTSIGVPRINTSSDASHWDEETLQLVSRHFYQDFRGLGYYTPISRIML